MTKKSINPTIDKALGNLFPYSFKPGYIFSQKMRWVTSFGYEGCKKEIFTVITVMMRRL